MFISRIYVKKLFQRNGSKSFFQNTENKQALIDLLSNYLVLICFPVVIKILIVFTNDRNTLQVTEQNDQLLLTCIHEEADPRVVLRICPKDTNCIVASKNTDVFVLMVFPFAFKSIKRSDQ